MKFFHENLQLIESASGILNNWRLSINFYRISTQILIEPKMLEIRKCLRQRKIFIPSFHNWWDSMLSIWIFHRLKNTSIFSEFESKRTASLWNFSDFLVTAKAVSDRLLQCSWSETKSFDARPSVYGALTSRFCANKHVATQGFYDM